MKLGIGEVLTKAAALSTKAERIEYLRKQYTPEMGMVLQAALDPNIEWELPKTRPMYRPGPVNGDQQYVLHQKAKKLNMFFKGHFTHVTPEKKAKLFLQLLEMMEPEDSELLAMAATERKLPYKGFTVNFINEVWPGLIVTKAGVKVE